jgi:hypothetical protein
LNSNSKQKIKTENEKGEKEKKAHLPYLDRSSPKPTPTAAHQSPGAVQPKARYRFDVFKNRARRKHVVVVVSEHDSAASQ